MPSRRPSRPVTAEDIAALQPEKDIQAGIVAYLQALRCTVLITYAGQRGAVAALAREKGAKVGNLSTPGVPDLLVSRRTWPVGFWLGLEVKRPKVGVLSPEQKQLVDAGRIVIVRSIADAEKAITDAEAELVRRACA